MEWDSFTISSWYKDEEKEKEIKLEYLNAYLNASKDIQKALYARTHINPGTTTYRNDQTCVPFLFLCRHLIELTIKYKLGELDINYSPNHKIKNLWKKLILGVKEYNPRFDELIETLNYTDKEGLGLRYPYSNKKKLFDKGPVSIHSERIMKITEELYNFIMSLKKG